MYLILKNKKEIYFWKDLSKNYNVEELYSIDTDSFIFKVLKKIKIISIGKWKKDIKKYDEFIIFESMYNKKISEIIKKKNKNCKVILYFWNPINENTKNILKDSNIDEFWTFDKMDSLKYKIKYNPQFYTKIVKISKDKNIENDITFLGRPKNRKNDILKIKNILDEKKLMTNFKIIDNEKDFVSYNQYLQMLSKSKCILDYNQNGQVGLSLRPMEALFLQKKLITNNKDIKTYNFYNSNNIFILGEDNIEKIKDFIDSPYKKIDQKIIDYYDFEQWLKRFEG